MNSCHKPSETEIKFNILHFLSAAKFGLIT
jgi:hypothetical protein